MSFEQELAALRASSVFRALPEADLKLLSALSEIRAYPGGEDIVTEGDFGDAAYVLLEGEADVFTSSRTDAVLINRIMPNELFGEIAILCDIPRTATVRAREAAKALRVSRETFTKIAQERPEIAIELARVLALRLEAVTASFVAASPGES